jgi:murein DD-endopeptidase / murein LD-carboxypeptidase
MISTISIPQMFFNSKYDASKYPGSKNCSGLVNGANCQYFAYELLKHFGRIVPDFRSSNLWEDSIHTMRVVELEPLDLLLFNKNENSYGAHIGVYLGENKVIHLCKEVGFPIVWDMEEFGKRNNYSYFIGAKRVLWSPSI